jgi:hypothetical protein
LPLLVWGFFVSLILFTQKTDNMKMTDDQKNLLREEAKSGTVGIETLKLIEKFKAGLISEIHKTHKNLKEGKTNALGTVLNFMDDACFLARLIRKYKDVFAESQDLDETEGKELHDYFIECLKSEGFNVDDSVFYLVTAIDEYELQTKHFLDVLAKFKK